jgi:hypothetical protein
MNASNPYADPAFRSAAPGDPGLDVLWNGAAAIARHHGIPVHAVLIHGLSAASALAWTSVGDEPEGPAVLPLLIRTPGPPPDWIASEWRALERLTALPIKPVSAVEAAASAEQQLRARIRELLDTGSTSGAPTPEESSPPPPQHQTGFGRVAITRGVGRLACGSKSKPLTHLSASLPRVRAALQRLDQHPDHESLIALVDSREFKALAREHGLNLSKRLGLVLPVPGVEVGDPSLGPPQPLSELMFQALASNRQGKPPSVPPDPKIREIMEAHGQQRQLLAQALPEVLRNLIPDPARVWHLSALLTALCAESDHPGAAHAAARLASALDHWAIGRHLRAMRTAFPADGQGLFGPAELRVFRQLDEAPQCIRQIQRSLRGTHKAQIQAALDRATNAGLAAMLPGQLYRLAEAPEFDLSENARENPERSFSVTPQKGHTETTEKSGTS